MEWPVHWWDLAVGHYSYALLMLAALVSVVQAWPIPLGAMFGRIPAEREFVGGAKFSVFLMLVSIAAAYALFYPLSYVAPDFVTWWFIELPDFIYFDADDFPVIANISSLLLLCGLVPVVEEFIFRGIILPRWTHKWGMRPAMIASSAVFGIVHADPIGAFLFAIGMSVLYLRSQSLYLPIFCHAFNNFVVWVWAWVDIANYGPDYEFTLQEFRAEWFWGVGSALAAIIWIGFFLRKPRSEVAWKFPVT